MNLRNAAAVCAVPGLAAVTAVPASAGPCSDEMAKCLVESTSNADRRSLVRRMFAAAALHPEVKSITSVSAEQRTELSFRRLTRAR